MKISHNLSEFNKSLSVKILVVTASTSAIFGCSKLPSCSDQEVLALVNQALRTEIKLLDIRSDKTDKSLCLANYIINQYPGAPDLKLPLKYAISKTDDGKLYVEVSNGL